MRGEYRKEAKIKKSQVNGVEAGQEEMKKQGGDLRNGYKTYKQDIRLRSWEQDKDSKQEVDIKYNKLCGNIQIGTETRN